MKNLKIYLLLILGIFAVSTVFTSELIAQTKKKPRKKTTTTKKKTVKKETAPVEKFTIDPNAVQVIPANSGGGSGVAFENSSTTNSGVKTVSGGVVNGKALDLVKPEYPPAAKAVKASGAVNVQVTIDEEGNVISASAISGHPLLRATSVSAALQSKFSPTTLQGQRVKVTGVIVYNFTPK
ncbi:MAG: energy transducer TonB [Pyrinomonadaceae bacterium]|nr:energy transducer TonB [Pyrinomonadaceae bacterium]